MLTWTAKQPHIKLWLRSKYHFIHCCCRILAVSVWAYGSSVILWSRNIVAPATRSPVDGTADHPNTFTEEMCGGGAKLKKTFCHSPYGLAISMYFGFREYSWTTLLIYKTWNENNFYREAGVLTCLKDSSICPLYIPLCHKMAFWDSFSSTL